MKKALLTVVLLLALVLIGARTLSTRAEKEAAQTDAPAFAMENETDRTDATAFAAKNEVTEDEAAQNDAARTDALLWGAEDVLLVNRDNPLPADYAPDDLVNLYEQERYFQLAKADISLTRETYEAMNRMFARAEADGVDGFIVTSGFRTEAKQRELYEADAEGVAAAPGQSEHQTGLAFDVTAQRDSGGFETTAQFGWLDAHCAEYGFILRYPEGAEDVTGFAYEPWHYRYVGVEIAGIIRDNGWTLEEYREAIDKY